MSLDQTSVWITGARGFIGRHLARHLSAGGASIAGIGHGAWPATDAARWGVGDWLNGDIQPDNLGLLAARGGLPQTIYHLAGGSMVGAALAAPREDFVRTVGTTAELLDWVRREAPMTRVVAVSSAAVYGAGHDGPIREDAALRPASPYGHHKAMMEQLCRSHADSYGARVAIVRLFSVYGPGLQKQLLWDLCERLAAGERTVMLGGSGAELRDWTDVADVVRLLAAAAEMADPAAPVLNGGSGIATAVSEVAKHMVADWSPAVTLGFSGESRRGDPFALVADPTQLVATGFRFGVPVAAGIDAYLEWYRTRQPSW